MLNPLKYLRQPQPTPSLPVKMAVIGPPKSGKTTGKSHDSCKMIHSKFQSFSLLCLLFTLPIYLLHHFISPVAQIFAQRYGLARLSIGSVIRNVLDNQAHTDLALQMKKHLSNGLIVPDELAIQCLEVALMSSVCNNRGYARGVFSIYLFRIIKVSKQRLYSYTGLSRNLHMLECVLVFETVLSGITGTCWMAFQ